jgi:hypothetical protein
MAQHAQVVQGVRLLRPAPEHRVERRLGFGQAVFAQQPDRAGEDVVRAGGFRTGAVASQVGPGWRKALIAVLVQPKS